MSLIKFFFVCLILGVGTSVDMKSKHCCRINVDKDFCYCDHSPNGCDQYCCCDNLCLKVFYRACVV